MSKAIIHTTNAPQAIGTYSQAIRVGDTIYCSGQIPLDPNTMDLVGTEITAQVEQVFANLSAVCIAAGGTLNDIVKLTIYLVDLAHFPVVNEVMSRLFAAPYPARTTIQISALPKAAQVEVDAIMVINR
jgi:reactive intermediate/imine deaminase